MQPRKCSLDLYVHFLIASQKQYSGSELSRVAPGEIAHDAVSRWLKETPLTPKLVWQQSQSLISKTGGYLILDDTLLDKPYALKMALVSPQYSAKHHGVINGIALVTLLWADKSGALAPVDYRIYDPTHDAKTKPDHALEMLEKAARRGLQPRCVLMDSWYASVKNFKALTRRGWKWIAALKSNRQVSLVPGTYQRVDTLDWTKKTVRKVWLKAYGWVLVGKIVLQNGDIAYVATNDFSLTTPQRLAEQYHQRWDIETFHRGLKQCCGIEKCYSTLERSQRNHILCAFLAFIKLEWQRLKHHLTWYTQKWSIPRKAISAYLAANA